MVLSCITRGDTGDPTELSTTSAATQHESTINTTDQICAVLDFACNENHEQCQGVTSNTWIIYFS